MVFIFGSAGVEYKCDLINLKLNEKVVKQYDGEYLCCLPVTLYNMA